MKKRALVFITTIGLCIAMVGCVDKREYSQREIDALNAEITQLEIQRDSLKNEIVGIKEENGTAKYVVTFNIRQSHFSLDITQHIKDEMNDISIQIPVDKEYYDSINIGDTIADDFRMGSLIMKGSFGNWNVTVENKEIR